MVEIHHPAVQEILHQLVHLKVKTAAQEIILEEQAAAVVQLQLVMILQVVTQQVPAVTAQQHISQVHQLQKAVAAVAVQVVVQQVQVAQAVALQEEHHQVVQLQVLQQIQVLEAVAAVLAAAVVQAVQELLS